MANNFQNSLDLFKKAKRKIPLASQTFSKSQISYNFENGPIFLDRGRGAFVWDIDGNPPIQFKKWSEFIDLLEENYGS